MGNPARVMICAGEASGDLHAARVVRALGEAMPGVQVSGLGGPALEAAGVDLVERMEDLAVMGFSDLPSKLGVIWSKLRSLRKHLAAVRPNLLITVDFPDFNLRLARAAKDLGIPTLHYVGPQVWAWRPKRARKVQRVIDHLAVVFAFEPPVWQRLAPDLKVSFVGHPLVDELEEVRDVAGPLPIPEQAEVVGLLPGSRLSEVKLLLPVLLEAATIMREKRPGLHFALPLAPGLDREALEPYLDRAPPGLSIVKGEARRVMQRARLLLVTSGTATLEATLAGTPMVVVYRTSALNYLVALSLVKLEHISLPNLVAGREVVPELIQSKLNAASLAKEALDLLEDQERYAQVQAGLVEVRETIGPSGAGTRVAELAKTIMKRAAG